MPSPPWYSLTQNIVGADATRQVVGCAACKRALGGYDAQVDAVADEPADVLHHGTGRKRVALLGKEPVRSGQAVGVNRVGVWCIAAGLCQRPHKLQAQ